MSDMVMHYASRIEKVLSQVKYAIPDLTFIRSKPYKQIEDVLDHLEAQKNAPAPAAAPVTQVDDVVTEIQMTGIRKAIEEDRFDEFRRDFFNQYDMTRNF